MNNINRGKLRCLYIADVDSRIERRWLCRQIKHDKSMSLNEDAVFFFSSDREKNKRDIRKLGAWLASAATDTNIIPLRIIWPLNRRSSDALSLRKIAFGDDGRPGFIRAYQLLRSKIRPEYLIGDSASVADLQARFGSDEKAGLAAFITRQAGLSLDVAERKRADGRFKLPRYVADSIDNSEQFNKALTTLAAQINRPVDSLRGESKAYLRELISVPKRVALDLRVWLDSYMISQGYEKDVVYSAEAIEKLRDIVKDHPTMVLWTHKIYYDGSVVTSVLHKHRFPLLHMFGGINMAFMGLGYILRHSGAIFIRRSFQDNALYKLVLRQYIAYLMEKRFPLSWAFEGTRSRIGKLMPPRYGLLKYVLESAHEAGIGNIHIIPVSISYDFMRDVEDFASEQTGKEKKPESLKWFLGYVSSLRRPMGRIYMDIADPVVIKTAPLPGDRLALAKTAFEVAVRVNEVSPITLTSLFCFCLLGAAPQALTKQELHSQVTELADWALARNIRISSDFDPKNAIHTEVILNILIKNGLLSNYDQGAEVVIGIAPDQHSVASYYRNMIVHHYLNKAILEMALLKLDNLNLNSDEAMAVIWQEADLLRDVFKFEFFYPTKDKFRELLELELDRVNGNWRVIIGQKDGSSLLLQEMMPIVAHSVFLPFVEAYTVLTEFVASQPVDQKLLESTCVSQSLKQAKQAYLQRRITSEASIAKLLFSNAFKLLDNLNLISDGGADLVERRIELSKIFRDKARSLDLLRMMALPKY